MRLLLAWWGYELDISFGPTTVDEPDDDRGDCLTYPVGFVRPEIPWDHDCPPHQFDPDAADENP